MSGMSGYITENGFYGWQYGLVLANGVVVLNARKFDTEQEAENAAQKSLQRLK